MGDQAVVSMLHAAVRVNEVDKETGETLLQPVGFGNDGRAIMRPATRIVLVQQGDPLPPNVAAGEQQRLEALGALKIIGNAPAKTADASAEPAVPDPDDLAALTDEQLVEWLETASPGIRKVMQLVGKDPELAGRLIAAETTASKGDPRGSLVEKLERVKKGGEAS